MAHVQFWQDDVDHVLLHLEEGLISFRHRVKDPPGRQGIQVNFQGVVSRKQQLVGLGELGPHDG